jgi:hypothetical protein
VLPQITNRINRFQYYEALIARIDRTVSKKMCYHLLLMSIDACSGISCVVEKRLNICRYAITLGALPESEIGVPSWQTNRLDSLKLAGIHYT